MSRHYFLLCSKARTQVALSELSFSRAGSPLRRGSLQEQRFSFPFGSLKTSQLHSRRLRRALGRNVRTTEELDWLDLNFSRPKCLSQSPQVLEEQCSESYCPFDRYQEQQEDLQTKENIFLRTGICLRGVAEDLLIVSESLVGFLRPAKLPRRTYTLA